MRPIGCKDRLTRLIDLKMFFEEYPVCVISVAVVKQDLFLFKSLLCFTIEGVYFLFPETLKQSFEVCLQINCVVTKDPGTHCFLNWGSMVLDWDSRFVHKMSSRTHYNYL